MDIDRQLLRRVAAAEVVSSIAAFAAGLAALALGYPRVHAIAIAMLFYPLFVHPIAVVYVVSGIPRPSQRLIAYLLSTLAVFLVAGVTAFSLGPPVGWLPLGLAMLYSIPAPLAGLRSRQRSFRLSMILASLAYGGAGLVSLSAYSSGTSGPSVGTMFVATFAVSMIYAVTVHSLPRTYKEEPSMGATILLAVLIASASILYSLGYVEYSRTFYSLTVLPFLMAARMDKLPLWYRGIEEAAPAARPGHRYFLQGHMFAIPLMLLSGFYLAREWSSLLDALAALHALTIGFTGVFIYIHAPMMLPVLLKTRTRRRYNVFPYILLALATLVWPGAGFLAGLFFAASLAALLYIIV